MFSPTLALVLAALLSFSVGWYHFMKASDLFHAAAGIGFGMVGVGLLIFMLPAL